MYNEVFLPKNWKLAHLTELGAFAISVVNFFSSESINIANFFISTILPIDKFCSRTVYRGSIVFKRPYIFFIDRISPKNPIVISIRYV